jgi:hypothetical protein
MAQNNQQDRRAIVCGISGDHAFALAALMVGVARHNPDFAGDFVVFHDGVDAGVQSRLRAIWPKTRFCSFGHDEVTRRFGPGVDVARALASYSPMIFAKFEMLDLLAEYRQCLWLDVDILVQGDMSGLWAFDALAWRPLPDGAFARREKAMAALAALRRDGVPLLNGGVIGMGQGLRGVAKGDLYAMAARIIAAVGPHSVDELALYFLACARGLPLHQLPQRFNHPVVAPGGRDAVLVHAIGPDKFWNAAPLQLAYPEWAQNAAGWPYDGAPGLEGPATPDAALKAARNRAYWLGIYDRLRPDLPLRLRPDLRHDGPALRLFIAGLPDTAHLRLTRQKNDRRIGLEVCFPDEKPHSLAFFGALDGVAILTGVPLELTRTKQGWTYGAVLPLAEIAPALAQIMAALDKA